MTPDSPRKLYIMQGLPGSGKTTRRKALVKQLDTEGKSVAVISKDSIREAQPELNERGVHNMQRELMHEAMVNRLNIVLDNCNLDPRSINEYNAQAAKFHYETEIVRLDTGVIDCIINDLHRRGRGERYVGQSVIRQMAQRYGLLTPPKREDRQPAIVCDLDGTLCNIAARRHYIDGTDGPKKNWDGFFSEIHLDLLNEELARLLHLYDSNTDYRIIYLSGRSSKYRRETELWLEKHKVDFQWALYMRPENDKRDDTIIKATLYDRFVEPFFDVKLVFDDRNRIVDQWRDKYGLTCFQVAAGAF